MLTWIVALNLLGIRLVAPLGRAEETLRRRRDDRGSVTIEQVIWAVAMIGIAAIVVGAITAYVKNKANDIK